jgi:nucleoside-diphosphate-sugar epimerase
MRTFVLGATGFVGGGIARHLAAQGHEVTGSARGPEAAARLESQGIAALVADLEERRDDVIAEAVRADAVVYAAATEPDVEQVAVEALVDALAGTGKSLIFTSGSGVFLQRTGGAWSEDSFAEDDEFTVEPLAGTRRAVEEAVRAAGARDLRAMVIRPGLIWGPGDHGHVSMVYASVAATGSACYVGDGLATYSHVHIDDVARLFGLALEKGTPGALYHAVAGETPNRWIAEAVAADVGCSARSIDEREAAEVWGEFGALIMSASSRSRAPRTRRELGWKPERLDMLAEIGEPRFGQLARTK